MWLACVYTYALVFVLICVCIVYMFIYLCVNFVCGIYECICVYVSVQCVSSKHVFVCILMCVCVSVWLVKPGDCFCFVDFRHIYIKGCLG